MIGKKIHPEIFVNFLLKYSVNINARRNIDIKAKFYNKESLESYEDVLKLFVYLNRILMQFDILAKI